MVLLTRSILSFKWNLLMPISKVDENMKRAQRRDAVLTEKFWWRKDIFTACEDTSEPELTEMSIDEILNGIPGSEYQVEDTKRFRQIQMEGCLFVPSVVFREIFGGIICNFQLVIRCNITISPISPIKIEEHEHNSA